jgi:hypothetical protein
MMSWPPDAPFINTDGRFRAWKPTCIFRADSPVWGGRVGSGPDGDDDLLGDRTWGLVRRLPGAQVLTKV